MKIYGAYGSNMNIQQMQMRCPNAELIGNGKILNNKLTFRGRDTMGVANVEEKCGRSVPIVLWAITDECEKALDSYEGFPRLYVKKDIEVLTTTGSVKAMFYVMAKKYENMPAEPSQHYFNIIKNGYEKNRINTKTLNYALKEIRRELADTQIGSFDLQY